jgi:threonylcarbamoyladenosine tRNA methylthiotransferase MtaB
VMANSDGRVAPHLHMPLQSGDDDTLRRMNRWYNTEEYLTACRRIRARLDRPAFTADVLVGFPGETEKEFANTIETVRSAGFTRLHVFPFSARPGTAAATMSAPVQPDAVRDRRARLSEVASELSEEYRRSLVGAHERVILEGFGGLSGRYQRVRIEPDWIDGVPPPALDVTLELRETKPDSPSELWGRPLSHTQGTATHA